MTASCSTWSRRSSSRSAIVDKIELVHGEHDGAALAGNQIRDGKVAEVWQRTDQYLVDDFFSYGASRRPKKRHKQAIPVAGGTESRVTARA